MSPLMHELLPIIFMFGVALLLGPLVGITMWMAFDGDRLRANDAAAAPTATSTTEQRAAAQAPRATRETTTAA